MSREAEEKKLKSEDEDFADEGAAVNQKELGDDLDDIDLSDEDSFASEE